MKLGVLFSGGKDSTMAAYIAKKTGHELSCLISIFSENKDSYMFHTPSIQQVKGQARVMELPLIIGNTIGKEEEELGDLEQAIFKAKKIYGIEGIITGAIASVYQSTRIQKICDKLNLECFNPLWQKPELDILQNLIEYGFKVIIVSIAAEGLDKSWLGREIDLNFIKDIKILKDKYKIHPAGEGGEFETFVLYCPLFTESLRIKDYEIYGEGNAWRMELQIQ